MALVSVYVVYSVRDETNKISTFRIPFPTDSNLGQLQTFAWSTAELIDPLIRGQIVDIGISLGVEFGSADIKAAPISGSDVEEGAYFGFESAAGFATGFTLPTFDEAFVVEASDNVDLSDSDVDDFVHRILQGKTDLLVNVSPSDSRGSDITAINVARESFRKTRRA